MQPECPTTAITNIFKPDRRFVDDPAIPVVVVGGLIAAGVTWISWEIYEACFPEDEIEPYVAPPIEIPLIVAGEKTMHDLVPGSLKKSPSWHDPYGTKTAEEIDNLAKGGDKLAQGMKKLKDQAERLLKKVNQKHK